MMRFWLVGLLLISWGVTAVEVPEVEMTGGRYYLSVGGQQEDKYYNAQHTAYAAAITRSFLCDCAVVVIQPEVRVVTRSPGGTPPVAANNVVLSWDIPTLREDGSALALSDIEGYGIRYGIAGSDVAGRGVLEVAANAETYTFVDMPPTSYVFSIYTRTAEGVGQDSAEIVVVVE